MVNPDIPMRIAALKVRLMELYTPEEAHHWLYNPQRVFDGHCPVDMLTDMLGYLEVDNVVDQLLECTYL
jgi:uncharacterized protein (DUF2384 family)